MNPTPAVDSAGALPNFASTKREILLTLKRAGEGDLGPLPRRLRVSKMAVYRHVKDLEASGLIERSTKRSGVGRPRLTLKLAPGRSVIFPQAYSSITCAVLEFIEQKMRREGV